MSRFYISAIIQYKNAKNYKNGGSFRNESDIASSYLRHIIKNRQDMAPERRIKIAAALQRMVYVVFALFLVLFIIYLFK